MDCLPGLADRFLHDDAVATQGVEYAQIGIEVTGEAGGVCGGNMPLDQRMAKGRGGR